MRFWPFWCAVLVAVPGVLRLPVLGTGRQTPAPTIAAAAAARHAPPLVNWRTDLDAATAEAQQANKPLLVVFQCARRSAAARGTLDAQLLRSRNDPALAFLLNDFVPVRVGDLKNVDLARFAFDYDLTFAVVMTNPATGETLARFGARDADGDAGRTSLAGLKRVLRAVQDDGKVGRRGALRTATAPRPFTPALYPAWGRTRAAQNACYHCHYASDARILQERANGTFATAKLFAYPLPETIGLTLDRDKNNVARTIRPGSPAAKAGVRPGDVVTRANETAVYSSADLQFALNAVPEPGQIRLRLMRGGRLLPRPTTLALPAGWRTRNVDISWRPSQGGVPPFLASWEEPLTPGERRRAGVPPNTLALRVTTLFAGEKWERLRGDLRVGDVIVGLDNKSLPDLSARQFHSLYRLSHAVGDTAVLTVRRAGVPLRVPVFCGDVRAE